MCDICRYTECDHSNDLIQGSVFCALGLCPAASRIPAPCRADCGWPEMEAGRVALCVWSTACPCAQPFKVRVEGREGEQAPSLAGVGARTLLFRSWLVKVRREREKRRQARRQHKAKHPQAECFPTVVLSDLPLPTVS